MNSITSAPKRLNFVLIYYVSECDDWTYGYDCVKNCSGHCLNNTPCNKQTGHCESGCDPGYKDKDCSKSIFL